MAMQCQPQCCCDEFATIPGQCFEGPATDGFFGPGCIEGTIPPRFKITLPDYGVGGCCDGLAGEYIAIYNGIPWSEDPADDYLCSWTTGELPHPCEASPSSIEVTVVLGNDAGFSYLTVTVLERFGGGAIWGVNYRYYDTAGGAVDCVATYVGKTATLLGVGAGSTAYLCLFEDGFQGTTVGVDALAM